MRILVLPRDTNPYLGLLYGEMQRRGAQITYLGELTPSRTLNLLLLPLEVGARRIAGARLIHLHWVFVFTLPGARRFPVLRRAAQVWFAVWLRMCRVVGTHLVWTAHNVLPHEPVFADDVAARRALVEACDLVIAHSQSALDELAALGTVVRRSAVIPHGPITLARSSTSPPRPRAGDGTCRFLFFGQVREYKGVDDLLTAFLALPDDVAAQLTIAGKCDDLGLWTRLHGLAARAGTRVVLRLEHLPEEELADLLDAADVVVLPFRRVTNSASAMLALSHGRPLIVPDMGALIDLPDQAVCRYNGGMPGLIAALAHMARADGEVLAAMSAAGGRYASRTTWQDMAERTMAEMISVVAQVPQADSRRESARAP
jgi:glycosyltransferase involved in cell wall biosynthesis